MFHRRSSPRSARITSVDRTVSAPRAAALLPEQPMPFTNEQLSERQRRLDAAIEAADRSFLQLSSSANGHGDAQFGFEVSRIGSHNHSVSATNTPRGLRRGGAPSSGDQTSSQQLAIPCRADTAVVASPAAAASEAQPGASRACGRAAAIVNELFDQLDAQLVSLTECGGSAFALPSATELGDDVDAMDGLRVAFVPTTDEDASLLNIVEKHFVLDGAALPALRHKTGTYMSREDSSANTKGEVVFRYRGPRSRACLMMLKRRVVATLPAVF